MDDMLRPEPEARRNARLARGTGADLRAGRRKLGSCRTMDRAADAAARKQPLVRRIDDGLDIQLGDVAFGDLHPVTQRSHVDFARAMASTIMPFASSASAQR